MTKEELKKRTKLFAIGIIKLVNEFPNSRAGYTIGNQMIRSGTSVAANYRAACRARSDADFVSKITIVEEECDETLFWLELTEESAMMDNEKILKLKKEANELTAIFTASGKTARQRIPKSQIRNNTIVDTNSHLSHKSEIPNPKSEISDGHT